MISVTVRLHGITNRLPGNTEPLELTLPDGATAGHVLRELGRRYGKPFPDPDLENEAACHGTLRVFVDGELSLRPDQTVLRCSEDPLDVTVVITSPVAGGA